MPRRPAQSRLSPWIEGLILGYDSQEGSRNVPLKAHVIGVGTMSQSQARGPEDPTGLLFLSDGVLQIPAILTASAWEHLQEQEDRESFTSLLNTTVYIQDHQLQFHMAPEQTKCRFFLSLGELVTTAAGPMKDSTPCSKTLPSIQRKIFETWRSMLDQGTQEYHSQCGFDLTELLEEWQNECHRDVLKDVLKDVQDMLEAGSCPPSPQPSTSTDNSALTHLDTFTATSWDNDRIRYKAEKCFSVPMKYLLIPEEVALHLQTPPNVGSRTISGLSASETVDDAEWGKAQSAVVERAQDSKENCPAEDSILHEDTIQTFIDDNIRPLSNPWDIFPPPIVDSSSSDGSLEAAPSHSLHNPTATDFTSVIFTSTQLPLHNSRESLQTPEQSKGEHSCLPPYQKQPPSASIPATAGSSSSASVSLLEPFTTPSNLVRTTVEHHGNTAQRRRQILEKDVEGTKGKFRKRKRSEPTAEALATLVEEEVEEAQINVSPPSWLFDSQAGIGTEEGSSHKQGQTAATVLRKSTAVHSNGKPFSYTYQVSGQNLQDFSQFKVTDSLVQWAVKYLVPKTDNPQDASKMNSNKKKIV